MKELSIEEQLKKKEEVRNQLKKENILNKTQINALARLSLGDDVESVERELKQGMEEQKRDIVNKVLTEEETRIQLQYAYQFIKEGLKKYLDMNEENYNLIALWIIGTYSHHEFPSYPYLFLNAMRGSGKSRTMKLINFLSKDSSMLNSLTDAVLFRTKGTLCIDEFEGIGRKGTESLKELLNSAYKKGTKVKRMKKIKVLNAEEQVVEEFDVYRPIVMANIYGLIDEALKDRCITLILEKSDDKSKTNLIELFEFEENLQNAKEILKSCSLCSVVSLLEVYKGWNLYVTNTNYTHTQTTQTTQTTLNFDKIKETGLNGREIELCLPLFILAEQLGVLDETLKTLKDIFLERKETELNENLDISLYDFFSTLPESDNYISIKEIVRQFKEFSGRDEDFINDRWVGRRLTTLKLFTIKKRMGNGIYIIPDYKKAQEKIKMFR